MAQQSESTHLIRPLEGLRGVLALWVCLFHILTIGGLWVRIPPPMAALLDGGNAVDVFIILSGFVVTMLIVRNAESYGVFIARRFVRLYPAFAIAIAFSLLLQAVQLMPVRYDANQLWAHLLTHAFMLFGVVPSHLPGSGSVILNPAWSISLEWQFYLVAPFLVGLASKGVRGLIVSSLLVVIGYRLVLPILTGFDGSFLLAKIHLFWIGWVSCLAYLRYAGNGNLAWAWLLIALGVILLLPYKPNIGLIFWGIFTCALLGCPGFMQRWMASWPLMALGAISYPLYLFHEPVIWACKSIFNMQSADTVQVIGLAAVTMPLTILIAFLLHRYAEVPAIEWGRSVFKRRELDKEKGSLIVP